MSIEEQIIMLFHIELFVLAVYAAERKIKAETQ